MNMTGASCRRPRPWRCRPFTFPCPAPFPTAASRTSPKPSRRSMTRDRARRRCADGRARRSAPCRTQAIRDIRAPVIALCHHPLCLETGIARRARGASCARTKGARSLSSAHVVVTSAHTGALLERDFGVPAGEDLRRAARGRRPPRARGAQDGPCRFSPSARSSRARRFDHLVEALAGARRSRLAPRHRRQSRDHAPETARALRAQVDATGACSRASIFPANCSERGAASVFRPRRPLRLVLSLRRLRHGAGGSARARPADRDDHRRRRGRHGSRRRLPAQSRRRRRAPCAQRCGAPFPTPRCAGASPRRPGAPARSCRVGKTPPE